MKEQLIEFETAKLAKERGLHQRPDDGFCSCGYNITGELDGLENVEMGEYYYAPTQSLLQKWLREECGIHLYCKMPKLSNHQYVWVLFTDDPNYEWETHKKSKKAYDSYEKAMEMGLIEALKIIAN